MHKILTSLNFSTPAKKILFVVGWILEKTKTIPHKNLLTKSDLNKEWLFSLSKTILRIFSLYMYGKMTCLKYLRFTPESANFTDNLFCRYSTHAVSSATNVAGDVNAWRWLLHYSNLHSFLTYITLQYNSWKDTTDHLEYL